MIYAQRPFVFHRDQSIFFEDIEEHKRKSAQVIRQWMNTHQRLVLKRAKDAKAASIQNVLKFTHYFGNR
jgi:hypothetical protein